MVFSSNIFLFIFLPFALLCYYASPGRAKFVVLTLLSYLFYAWSDPRFVLLLLWVTAFDFVLGHLIYSATSRPMRRVLLGVSLTNSLGLLVYFKYAVLGRQLMNIWRDVNADSVETVLSVILPAGISFYTFESISYVVDIYRGVTVPARSPVKFACYLAQFPHLVAGPIIRYQELASQMVDRPATSAGKFVRGAFFLSLGLAKKVLIADTVAKAVEPAFGPNAIGCLDTWWGMFAFAFQLYFDFSGYTDMAIGLALMLGFEFPRNFDAPYRATSITEFWRRWHMTLSRWLRDYLYIPLGGNRNGPTRTTVNLLLTMILGGLWHGASLNFAAWGLYHGIWLAVERQLGRRGIAAGWPRGVQVGMTFLIVCFGWILFRSDNLLLGLYRLVHLFAPSEFPTDELKRRAMYDPQVVAAMAIAAVVAFTMPQTWTLAERLTAPRLAWAILLFCASVVILAVNSSGPFLYFRF